MPDISGLVSTTIVLDTKIRSTENKITSVSDLVK